MLDRLPKDLGPPGDRKLRLFAAASCRRIWDLLLDERSRSAIEALERSVDDLETADRISERASGAERAATRMSRSFEEYRSRGLADSHSAFVFAARAVDLSMTGLGDFRRDWPLARLIRNAAEAAATARSFATGQDEGMARERKAQADLLREIFGNPYAPVPFDPSWASPDVLHIARAIDDDRAFERLPFLGDALEEAGCPSLEVLDHCRGPNLHVRGCWVLDAVLGRPGAIEGRRPT